MSSETADTGDKNIEEHLELLRDGYQQQHIYNKLDDLSEVMERSILQYTIADILFEEEFKIDEEAKEVVKNTRGYLEKNFMKPLEDKMGPLEEKVKEVDREGKIHQSRTEMQSTVEAIRKINKDIGEVDDDRLQKLESLLDNWDWETKIDWSSPDDTEAKIKDAEEFAQEMLSVYEDAKAIIGSEFKGSEIEDVVESLLNEGGLSLSELSESQRQSLANSTVGDYVEISLG
jgi:hypothetical protein